MRRKPFATLYLRISPALKKRLTAAAKKEAVALGVYIERLLNDASGASPK
jgi:predicted HicB family RNase H-like nuclease